MRSLFEKKSAVIVVSLTALGALMFLSIGLRSMSFSDAEPIGVGESEPLVLPPDAFKYPLDQVPRVTQIIVIVSFVLLLVLVAFLLSPEGRKRMLRILFRVAITALGIYYLMKNRPEIFAVFDFGAAGGIAQVASDTSSDIPPPVFVPPQPSPLLSYGITLALTFALLYIAWVLFRNKPNEGDAPSLKKIADIARASLRDLSSENNSTDVIMNCYYRMSDAVADKKSLRRGMGMTPSEFAARLEASGLPGESVQKLTRLFEGVRYGRKKAGAEERREAVDCLTAILNHCGETL